VNVFNSSDHLVDEHEHTLQREFPQRLVEE
jgi:hypothetical protein